jgi:hypothetical protein
MELVPYFELTPVERGEVHAWVRAHGLEPSNVPIDGILGRDEATSEWRIREYRTALGHKYLDSAGEPASRVVRRVERAPLPWRRVAA